jgi:hypothetical protein
MSAEPSGPTVENAGVKTEGGGIVANQKSQTQDRPWKWGHPMMRVNRSRALHGYRTRHYSATKPPALIPNVLQRNFDVAKPNEA